MISSVLISFASFVVLLSIVVIFHEYGHYKTGRLLGIGVERFAIGFGPALYTWTRDGVEFRLNLFPLGGYVKFVGDEPDQPVPDELRDTAFNTAPIYKRVLTVFAGPAMNLVLAFLLFCVIFLVGFPAPAAVVGDVSDNSPAQAAGLRPGDRIVAIDGEPIKFWHELSFHISDNPDVNMLMTVQRGEGRLTMPITPERTIAPHMLFMFDTEQGVIGVSPLGLRPLIGVSDLQSPAYVAGLRTGDIIMSINQRPVHFLQEIETRLHDAAGEPLEIEVARGEPNILRDKPEVSETIRVAAATDGIWTADALGLESGKLFIHSVHEGSPAGQAGLEQGDKLLSVNGDAVETWGAFTDIVRGQPDQPLKIIVLRASQKLEITVVPQLVEMLNTLGEKESFGQIGIQRLIMFTPIVQDVERYWNPLKIFLRGLEESWTWTVRITQGLYFIVVGKVPTSSLGGPIAIARMAGETARMGLIQFLLFMAIISVNLAFVNLIPIPIFDGGHILLFGVEALRGKPLGETGMGVALRIGIAVLAALFLLIFYNDFRWVFFKIKELLGA